MRHHDITNILLETFSCRWLPFFLLFWKKRSPGENQLDNSGFDNEDAIESFWRRVSLSNRLPEIVSDEISQCSSSWCSLPLIDCRQRNTCKILCICCNLSLVVSIWSLILFDMVLFLFFLSSLGWLLRPKHIKFVPEQDWYHGMPPS